MKNEKGISLIVLLVILVLAVVALAVVFRGNSNNNGTNIQNNKLTIENVISKFKEKGLKVELDEEKPFFQLIGAKDGVMLDIDGNPVKLYEYESEKAYKDALQANSEDIFSSFLKNAPRKELIVLDTEYQKVIDIFNSL